VGAGLRGFSFPADDLCRQAFAAAVNHLLARESWARDRLIPYAGKTARLVVPPVTLTLLVQPDGYLSAVDAHDAQRVDVSIALAGDTLAAFLQGGQAAVMKHVKIEGDAVRDADREARRAPALGA
jgi:ubiquinone biosynthesis protein UbiJ